MCQLGTESQQDYIALPLHVQMIPVKILFFSDYDFDADYDDSCVNDHEDCEIDDDIDVDSVGEVGVEDYSYDYNYDAKYAQLVMMIMVKLMMILMWIVMAQLVLRIISA